jgi:branched-chain amino acid aminotransferase
VIACLNGRFLPADDACIPISDRGFLFGDGVFETARLHRGRFFRLAEHLARLRRSAGMLQIPMPPEQQLADVARELARRGEYEEATLRIIVTRGADRTTSGVELVTLQPMPPDWRARAERGWRVITATTRRAAASSGPPALKAIGRSYALLARLEADAAGADDALLLSADDYVAEGPTWNVFWRVGERLFTPDTDVGILGGITRAIVSGIAADIGFDVRTGAYPATALDDADEIFATMTSVGIAAITELDGRRLAPRPAAAPELQKRYWQLVANEIAGE